MTIKRKIFITVITAIIVTPIVFFTYLYVEVTKDASRRIQKGIILQVINSESPVYYDDGVTPIGVFFQKTHRRYVPYKEIPKTFIKALVAAEDKNFFHHHGVDFKAIARALLANLKARRVVQGGSTLTQQTAKNIFKRERRSLMAKLKELIQAFLLERYYTKEEILEMYVNQFFVAGYGKGLGIAAKYFFDKGVKDLNLVECAFIAGSVQAPNRYNPFIKKTEAERQRARQLANERKNYVLRNMLKLHFISRQEYEWAVAQPVPFRKGTISYRLNVILDYVREQLDSQYFRNIFHQQGIDNIATSGIRIFTSVNKEIQEAAIQSLRARLPYMDVLLNGYNKPERKDLKAETAKFRRTERAIPFLARITHVDPSNQEACLVVSWKAGGGVISYEGVRAMAQAWLKWKAGPWARLDEKKLVNFIRRFHEGDLIWVQFIHNLHNGPEKRLALTTLPRLNGAIVVLNDGMVKAMVGGFYNRFFNRAVDAKRQLGSIFKPIVYTAALQLKWSNLDKIPNRRDMYEFEGTRYFPRPDHEPKSDVVSIEWAGVKSENLATVWLLYHLTDRLNMAEFRQVAEMLGLARKNDESYLQYKNRIRDAYGVVVNDESLMEAAFETAKNEVEPDLIFEGYENIIPVLRRLHWDIDPESIPPEYKNRTELSRLGFKRLRNTDAKMRASFSSLLRILQDELGKRPDAELLPELSRLLRGYYVSMAADKTVSVAYFDESLGPPDMKLYQPLGLNWLAQHYQELDSDQVLIDGLVPSHVIGTLERAVNKKYREFLTHKRYDMEVLWKIRDFRVLVNLSYVVNLARTLGITTHLDKVLSFPLGPNSISIMEAALAYQSIMSGSIHELDHMKGPEGVPIITKIEDRNGEVLWEYQASPVRVLTERQSTIIKDILRNVVLHGTGRRAKKAVNLSIRAQDLVLNIPVPTFGKTGTANRFTNSSFAGFVARLDQRIPAWDSSKGFVITAYVGYDDNKPMKSKHTEIYGASGALPLWIDTAVAIVNSPAYVSNVQLADLAFETLEDEATNRVGLKKIAVSPISGLPISTGIIPEQGQEIPVVLSDVTEQGKEIKLNRVFEPVGGPNR